MLFNVSETSRIAEAIRARTVTTTRYLGQTFTVGDFTVPFVALRKGAVRLQVTFPRELRLEKKDDLGAILETYGIGKDLEGWQRLIPRTELGNGTGKAAR